MLRFSARRSSREPPLRVGVVWEDRTSAANYRALYPLQALERRGHHVVWPRGEDGKGDGRRLGGVDVVLVYRRHDSQTLRLMGDLRQVGVGVVWDNDDDFTIIPTGKGYRQLGSRETKRRFADSVAAAKLAHVVTASTRPVAERYAEAGVPDVAVVPNMLAPDAGRAVAPRHEGVVVGWVAGLEHAADVQRIPIVDALERLLVAHPDVRIESIGVDLALAERYRHDAKVPFPELGRRIAGFDIAIAPLADFPFNIARSDIKLKEYAACGVPWLASPVGPYAGLGESEGGRLVADGGWFEAISELVTNPRARRRLSRRGRAWATRQTVDRHAHRWEQCLYRAAALGRGRAGGSDIAAPA